MSGRKARLMGLGMVATAGAGFLSLAAMMNSHRAGDEVTITIFRGRRKMDVQVKLGDAKNQRQMGQRT